jgi:hypothetical protein
MTPDTSDLAPITVSVSPTFSDYLRFNMWFAFRRLRVFVVFSVLWLCVFLSPLFLPGFGVRAGAFLTILPALLLPTFTFLVLPAMTYWAARKRWENVSELREQKTYTFADAGITVTGETFESFVMWDHITNAHRVGGQALLGTGQQQFHLIPVQAFATGELWDQFCRLVEAKVSGCRLS